MNKSQLKTYAPKARRDFIQMVRQRADVLGLTKAEIAKPEVQGDFAIVEGRPYPRRYAELHTRLAKKIEVEGLDQFLDRVAYSWFNRFAAVRFMEVNGYLSHPFRVLSNRDAAKSETEILEHAAEVTLAGLDKSKVVELKLAGNKDAELYKMLLIAQCNELHAAMPFLFERINDETELLLPDNLLHTDSVIRKMVSDIDEENWKEVEIVGWLYQFYISEKKDEVIGKTVKSEDIPAATQLFTPNWIVKYMVQNSLGRLWLETNPISELKAKVPMEFYIEPAADNPKIERDPLSPEEITVLDPACGSGHILVEAYDLLRAIYTERGYSSRDIPRLILKKNLFGLDIDERAAQLSNFALLMKARADDPKIFEQQAFPNILTVPGSSTLEYKASDIAEMFLHGSTNIDPVSIPIRDSNLLFAEMQTQPSLVLESSPPYEGGVATASADGVVRSRRADNITETNITDLLELFAQGKTLGSLIRIPDGFEKVIDNIEASIGAKQASPDMMEQIAARQLLPFVRAAKMLTRKYDCVIANPPYMGNRYQSASLKEYATRNFPDTKTDLFAMFVERNLEMTKSGGNLGFMSPFVWMFISSYEKLRNILIDKATITSLVQLEYSGFAEAVVPICTFTLSKKHDPKAISSFIRLSEFRGHQNQAPKTLEAIRNPECGWFFRTKPADFARIPGSPIAYWVSEKVREVYRNASLLEELTISDGQNKTGDNDVFLRFFWEVPDSKVGIEKKWFFYAKGGGFRKWVGNLDSVVNWSVEARAHYRKDLVCRIIPEYLWYKEGITWGLITSSSPSFRLLPADSTFDVGGSSVFFKDDQDIPFVLGLLNTKLALYLLQLSNPTLNFQVKNIRDIPVIKSGNDSVVVDLVKQAIDVAGADWNSFETSWDFKTFPILDLRSAIDKPPTDSVEECWNRWNELTGERINRMQELETENNRLFIDAYGLQDELSPEVPLDQITLARADKEKDTRRLLSYFIGCLMGRYSLDEPGLIYADAGNVGFDPTRYNAFQADDDGIVPVTDMEWFPQEAARQFEKFVKTVWGETKLTQNLGWIAQQLGAKAGEVPIDTIRRYFSQSFFKDHMQTYKKRPIYWLFSSGKQKAFECLVYLHRYNESTLPRMRHEYVLPLMSKLEAQIETLAGHADEYGTRSGGLIDTSSSTSERNKLAKQLETLKKKQVELAGFDEKLRHYADMRISLDLDDGVKVNYAKFGDLLAELKTITGTKD